MAPVEHVVTQAVVKKAVIGKADGLIGYNFVRLFGSVVYCAVIYILVDITFQRLPKIEVIKPCMILVLLSRDLIKTVYSYHLLLLNTFINPNITSKS